MSRQIKINKIVELVGGLFKPVFQLKAELQDLSDGEVHDRLLDAIRICARTDHLR